MTDDLQIFGEAEPAPPRDRRNAKARKQRARRRRRKRVITTLVVVALLAGAGAGAWYGWRELRGIGDVADYTGTGEGDVVIQVANGATTAEIGAELVRADVVASSAAFVRAASGNSEIRAIQPGYYVAKLKSSGAAAVEQLSAADARVGQLEIRGGTQFDDVGLPDGTVTPGIFSLLSQASCADLNGQSTCVPADQLQATLEAADPAALGVPEWARQDAAAAEPKRKLEGLVMPGLYDVRPGASAEELLKTVVTASAVRLQAAGLPSSTDGTGFRPYEVLVIASLVEREGIATDFGKVSRVVYNRLARPMPLQFDSTINYPLDRQEVRTTDDDRERPGPYNTYINQGLVPTPIAAASEAAIAAAINPEPGDWIYFVKCQTDGTSCFAATGEEHDANRRDAQQRGVF